MKVRTTQSALAAGVLAIAAFGAAFGGASAATADDLANANTFEIGDATLVRNGLALVPVTFTCTAGETFTARLILEQDPPAGVADFRGECSGVQQSTQVVVQSATVPFSQGQASATLLARVGHSCLITRALRTINLA